MTCYAFVNFDCRWNLIEYWSLIKTIGFWFSGRPFVMKMVNFCFFVFLFFLSSIWLFVCFFFSQMWYIRFAQYLIGEEGQETKTLSSANIYLKTCAFSTKQTCASHLCTLDWMWTINYIECKSSSSFWHGSWRGVSFIHNVRCSQTSLNAIYSFSKVLFFHLNICVFVSWILVWFWPAYWNGYINTHKLHCANRRYMFFLFSLYAFVCVWSLSHSLFLSYFYCLLESCLVALVQDIACLFGVFASWNIWNIEEDDSYIYEPLQFTTVYETSLLSPRW